MARLVGGGLKELLGLFDLDLFQGLLDRWRPGSSGGRSTAGRLLADDDGRTPGGDEPGSRERQDTEKGGGSEASFAPDDVATGLAALGARGGGPQLSAGPDVQQLFVTTLTPGPDNWTGTEGVDSVDGLDGADTLTALGGNDTLYGASGADRLFGGTGADWLFGGAGNDYAEGGLGADTLYGGGPPLIADAADSLVNTVNNLRDSRPFIAALPNGEYVVAWEQAIVPGSLEGRRVLFRRFSSDGSPIGNAVDFDFQGTTIGQAKGEMEVTALRGPFAGQFLVVWFSYEDPADDPDLTGGGDVHSAFMQRFNADGTAASGILEVNLDFDFTTSRPSVTALDDGSFMVVWQDQWRDTLGAEEGWGIYGQHYRPNGTSFTQIGFDVDISQTNSANQALPRSTQLANGDIVVVWNSDAGFNVPGADPGLGVYFRILRPDQTPPVNTSPTFVTNELRANWTTTGNQVMDQDGVTALAGGGFVIVWEGNGVDAVSGASDGSGVWFQIFNAAGQRLDANGNVVANGAINSERLLSSSTAGVQSDATVTALADGGFFAVWSGPAAALGDASGTALIGQRFDALGNRLGSEILINTTVFGDQVTPHVTQLANGTVVVVWEGLGTTGTDTDVFQRSFRFGSDGGNDTLLGNDNADAIYGEAGTDTLYGDNGGDILSGGDGTDSLYGGAGIDELSGGAGSDTLEGGGAGDTLFGGSQASTLTGNDTGDFASYLSSPGAVAADLSNGTAYGSDGADDRLFSIEHLYGSAFDDTLVGLGTGLLSDPAAGNNSLVGNEGTDSLYGLSGNDFLFGGSGQDWLVGGADADSIDGGAGVDTASYAASGAGVTVDLSNETAESGGDAEGDKLTNVENLVGSAFADVLIGNAGTTVNHFRGGDGNDTLDGRQGGDTLDGGSGNDWVWYNASGNAVTVNLGDGLPESGGMAAGDTLVSIENVLGSGGDDRLTGDAGANVLMGGSGNDVLATGGAGTADTLDGGLGNDTADYSAYNRGVSINLEAGIGSLLSQDDVKHSLIGVENIIGTLQGDTLLGDTGVNTIVAGDGNDFVGGGQGADTLYGGSGDDLLHDGLGAFADRFDGGAGEDTASYAGAGSAVAVSLLLGQGFTGAAAGDSLVSVEHLIGGNAGDTLIGSDGANSLQGGDGNDTLIGNLGGDLLSGGDGNDVIRFSTGAASLLGGSGIDTLVASDGVDVIDLWLGQFGTPQPDGDVTTHFNGQMEVVHLSGGNDTLYGAQADTLSTAATNLTVFGGTGDDDMTMWAEANDLLFGDEGNDTLEGGLLGDFLDGGTGSDAARYLHSHAAVTIDLSDGQVERGGTAEGDTLANIENLIGSNFDDTLTGNIASNWIQGGQGNDLLDGGGRQDSLFGGDGDDRIRYDAIDTAIIGGTGVDTLLGNSGQDIVQLNQTRWSFNDGVETHYAAIEQYELGDGNDWFLNSDDASHLEAMATSGLRVFGGSGNDSISMRGAGAASGIDDTVDGGAGNDQIWGGWGHDTLIGGAGNDNLYGGKGDDSLFGGDGFDIFYIGVDEGNDRIVDTGGGDNGLVLFWGHDSTFGGNYDGVDPSEVSIAYGATDVTITFLNSGSTVTFAKGEVTILNLWDYGDGDAGNGPTPPGTYERDVWSASWDGTQFTTFVLAVDG